DKELRLISLFAPEHIPPPPTAKHRRERNQPPGTFSTTPSCTRSGTAISSATCPPRRCAMLKAIHASKDVVAAREKAIRVIESYKAFASPRRLSLLRGNSDLLRLSGGALGGASAPTIRSIERPHCWRCKRLSNLASIACDEIATYQASCIRPFSISSRRDLFIFSIISSNFLIISGCITALRRGSCPAD